jgi:hypothetical protein
MRQLLMVGVMLASWSACATDANEAIPATSETQQAVSQIIGEKFDNLQTGPIGGQNGWDGDCVVVDGTAPDKYLKCVGGHWASKAIGLHGAGSYTMLVDLGPNINVVNSTHGKIFLEGPDGYVFQVIIGCDNIRAAFQQSGPTLGLLSFPCQSVSGPPAFRVICNWVTGGRVLSCGASVKPADPPTYYNLDLPSGMRPFDTVEITTYPFPGASLFDKIYIWQN